MDKQFDKEKIKLYGVIFLVAVFILVAINSARTIAKKRQAINAYRAPSAPALKPSTQAPVAATPIEDASKKEQKSSLEQKLDGLANRDPFKRQAAATSNGSGNENKGDIGGLLLTGIVYDSQNPSDSYCIINGQSVKAGEYVSGFTLKSVEENFAVLTSEKENKDYKVGLWGEIEQ
jgi:hypothetical protein